MKRAIITLHIPTLSLLVLALASCSGATSGDAPSQRATDLHADAKVTESVSAESVSTGQPEHGAPARSPGVEYKDESDASPSLAAPSAMSPTGGQGRGAHRQPRKRDSASIGGGLLGGAHVPGDASWDGGGAREGYDHLPENGFFSALDEPLSTFSIDVDTASYSNVRRMLRSGSLPPADAVRIEELVNYFDYARAQPRDDHPIALQTEVATCPWNTEHRLVRVALTTQDIAQDAVPARNLVFLIDVSGSMDGPDRLPLLQRAFALLTDSLRPQDSVAIVVYAGASGVVLPPTKGDRKAEIFAALEQLQAGGSTNGGAGIEAAYRLAERSFVRGGINRVILATDGDFNVGTTSQGELVRLIEQKRATGVYLSVLGFGTGNLQDSTMEQLADKGNGNYAYIDSIAEARKVLVKEAGATLVPVANDVKLQLEFNPLRVASYRLIGYENRILAHRDFNDDAKDAGELGAGHDVTALYEIVPAGTDGAAERDVDPLRYQTRKPSAATSDDLLSVKVRYKRPQSNKSVLMTVAVQDADRLVGETSRDFRLAAGVAEFGMLLRKSEHAGRSSYTQARGLIASTLSQASSSKVEREVEDVLELIDIAARLGRSRQ